MTQPQQATLFAPDFIVPIRAQKGARTTNRLVESRSGTFTDNMKLPIHRWFRYSAGFSAKWVENLVRTYRPGQKIQVLDPFAGSGTTLLAAAAVGASSVGFESHPFVARIAKAKMLWRNIDPIELENAASELIEAARKLSAKTPTVPPLLEKCYTPDAIHALFSLRNTLENVSFDLNIAEMLRLALTAILRPCSYVGTAQWQYVLPNKRKAGVIDPFDAMRSKVGEMIADIESMKYCDSCEECEIQDQDARLPSSLPVESVDLVVTSPPYPNNYDYADATRLEMTFWGEINGWSDLQKTTRKYLVHSCSQHTAAEKLQLDDLLALDELSVIREEITAVCRELEIVRLTKGGKKAYHTMIAAYYADLSKVFRALRPVCAKGSKLCFVIGDSAPYGVHAPAERWLGLLAEDAGFHSVAFEKLRDRNIKWKNRKHSVPLQEGRLWFEG
jgi:DNA modification methylase